MRLVLHWQWSLQDEPDKAQQPFDCHVFACLPDLDHWHPDSICSLDGKSSFTSQSSWSALSSKSRRALQDDRSHRLRWYSTSSFFAQFPHEWQVWHTAGGSRSVWSRGLVLWLADSEEGEKTSQRDLTWPDSFGFLLNVLQRFMWRNFLERAVKLELTGFSPLTN